MADPDTRIYGMADDANRQEPAENGLRGEGATDAANPAYRHQIKPDGQPAIVVEETSGVAFAETRRPEPAEVPQPVEPAPPSGALPPVTFAQPSQPPELSQPWREPAASGAGAGGATLPWVLVALVLGFAAGRSQRRARRAEPVRAAPAALTRMPGEHGGFSQVRDAGPEEMRDRDGRWSAVDEASDESFPASDPPSISMPGH